MVFEKEAQVILERLGMKKEEKLVLVVDENHLFLKKAFEKFVKLDVFYLESRPFRWKDSLKDYFDGFDVIIYCLDTFLEEREFRRNLINYREKDKRVLSMSSLIERAKVICTDYSFIEDIGKRFFKVLENAKDVVVYDGFGNGLNFSVFGRKLEEEFGDFSCKGVFGNFPCGELLTCPIEESFSGKVRTKLFSKIVCDVVLEFDKGELVSVDGVGSEEILKMLEDERTVGEFGIGLNPDAYVCENFSISEKALGTVHFAIGDSYGLGKNVSNLHYDFLVEKPTLVVGGVKVISEGVWML